MRYWQHCRRPGLSRLMPLLVALLLAQLGAQAHAYSHLHSGSQRAGALPDTRVCVECCLAAPLLGSVGPPAAAAAAKFDAPAIVPVAFAPAVRAVFRATGFRSRAPPVSP